MHSHTTSPDLIEAEIFATTGFSLVGFLLLIIVLL